MSRNGAVTPDWQFTVEVQEGETIIYKVCERRIVGSRGVGRPYA
ncbi:Maltodextrin glucosidase [Geobacillus proteiniphilus]|uniref:Maltodextrin glucosidase n=1 Tax=Geobacillus proteiniphilus TaxID=860353 RepID=A0A1Q5SLG8_9BACL|nr:Maltodextrin glucosidase [Geobacillus proteiniphilus]